MSKSQRSVIPQRKSSVRNNYAKADTYGFNSMTDMEEEMGLPTGKDQDEESSPDDQTRDVFNVTSGREDDAEATLLAISKLTPSELDEHIYAAQTEADKIKLAQAEKDKMLAYIKLRKIFSKLPT